MDSSVGFPSLSEGNIDRGSLPRNSTGFSRPKLLVALSDADRDDFLPEELQTVLLALPLEVINIRVPFSSPNVWNELLAGGNFSGLLSGWGTPMLPEDLPVGAEGLDYVCHLAGSLKYLVPRTLLERGLKATNWGNSASPQVAEGVLTLMLSALRRTSYWAVSMHRESGWKSRHSATQSLLRKRIGIHGFGFVARELVRLLQPFHGTISVHAPLVEDAVLDEFSVRRVNKLDELFASNDVLVDLAPGTPDNDGIINEPLLRLIQDGGVFVNAGRGGNVDEKALIKVAAEGRIQLALDVFEVEPLPRDSPLRGMPNVTLMPHLCGPTKDLRSDCGAFAIENLKRWSAGEPLLALVSPEIYDASS